MLYQGIRALCQCYFVHNIGLTYLSCSVYDKIIRRYVRCLR